MRNYEIVDKIKSDTIRDLIYQYAPSSLMFANNNIDYPRTIIYELLDLNGTREGPAFWNDIASNIDCDGYLNTNFLGIENKILFKNLTVHRIERNSNKNNNNKKRSIREGKLRFGKNQVL